MRSLRRFLIPVVLLAGLAFRMDDGGAALLPPPLPPPALPAPPPRLTLPGGAAPEDDGAAAAASRSTEIVAVGARSTKIVAPAAPKKQSLRELLVWPQPARHEPANLVSGEAKAEPSPVLQFYDNGTIQLVDQLSQSPLWEITGPPLSEHITTTDSGLNYLIYPLMNGNGTELWEVYNGSNVRLPWKLEEFVARSPYIRDSVVTVGSKVSTVFVVNVDSGEIIYSHSDLDLLHQLVPPKESLP